MDYITYLTAAEMAGEWGVTGRMAAKYCQAGRVHGAVKKGKVWLIPSGTERPADRRKNNGTVVSADFDENMAVLENPEDLNQIYNESLLKSYSAGNIYESLGISRETLRYYEKQGLISPKRKNENNYREFNFEDMTFLVAIDYYRKLGFSISEVKELFKENYHEILPELFTNKRREVEASIKKQLSLLNNLRDTLAFYETLDDHINKFCVKTFPLYKVLSTISDAASFHEYNDKVFANINMKEDALYTSAIRAFAVDENGYKGSKTYIVKKAEETDRNKHDMWFTLKVCCRF